MQQDLVIARSFPSHPTHTNVKLGRKERLFKVQVGVAVGKSNRQIARELGVDEGTVRRDRLTLKLSKEEIRAVKAGAAVEPLLRQQERQKAATAREKHEAAERESQFLTNRLAELVSTWLYKFDLIPANQLHVVMGVDPLSWQYGTTNPAYVCDSKIKATIEATKPKTKENLESFELIELLKAWLFRWIVLVEPDRDIRNRALTLVRQALERQSPAC